MQLASASCSIIFIVNSLCIPALFLPAWIRGDKIPNLEHLFIISQMCNCQIDDLIVADYSDAPEAPVRIVGKHLSGLRDALRQHICGEAALGLHSDNSP